MALRDELELIGRSDGSLRWYLTTKLPVMDPATGGVASLVSVSRDLHMPSDEGIAVESLTRWSSWWVRTTTGCCVWPTSPALQDVRRDSWNAG